MEHANDWRGPLLATKGEWEPMVLEKVHHGFFLKVYMSSNRHRWRFSVSKMEQSDNPPYGKIRLDASGYMKSRERAMKAAEAAADGLRKADTR